jgi:hypothetical protein
MKKLLYPVADVTHTAPVWRVSFLTAVSRHVAIISFVPSKEDADLQTASGRDEADGK